MSSARSTPLKKGGPFSGASCTTGPDDLIPPAMRILLNTGNPRSLEKLQYDYDLTEWEKAAIKFLKDDDNSSAGKWQMESIRVTAVKAEGAFALKANLGGQRLMPKGTVIHANSIDLTGPNVDICKRDNPTDAQKQTHTGVHTVHRLYLAAAFRVLLGASTQVQGGNTGVGAVIVSATGKILAWGKKNSEHPLLHAETSALLMYGQRLPKGARIYSTLKPCKMCRAAIAHFSEGGDFLAYYGQDDTTGQALGGGPNFVRLAGGMERPIWGDDKKGTDPQMRETINRSLERNYDDAHGTNRGLGIVDFAKDKKQLPHLTRASDYLTVKQRKYSNPALRDSHNANVALCLRHISAVMKQLGLPIPTQS
jgi:tRNA(Arg) A34 adenosine deaminase TadA